MATIPTQIRIDEETKKQAVELLAGLGLTLSDAVNIFLKQILLRGAVKQDKEAKKGNKEESVTDDAMRITEEDGGTKTEDQVTETADREGGADDEA